MIEMRRSTFVLQKLSSRVQRWDEFYGPLQEAMRADALMRYFHDLRTQIEKEGLPAAMAELVAVSTGQVLADVACGQDQHDTWIAGGARPTPSGGHRSNTENSTVLRKFRLSDHV